ncbi:cortical protein marker for cell polarity-domain-containing protein [Pilobolus umbonatus]|nr:cortical protein marker for cell polarity-domain-containing protein [Pilobolus umbonatus]
MIRFYALLIYILSIVTISYAESVTYPSIDFNSIHQLGISGTYSGISLYKDTQQLTQIPPSTSSVISLTNETLQLLLSSSVDGSIYDACTLDTTVYFGGNFSSINGIAMNNIGSIDTATNKVTPLALGLDGPVKTICCDADTKSVYVGGSFMAPVDKSMEAYSASLSAYGGSLAIWKNNGWSSVPWKGLNGPVNKILKDNNSVIFGGKFDTTADGQLNHAPATQLIPLPSTATASNSSTTYSDPSSIICAATSNSKPWILADGKMGSWEVGFGRYSVHPSLVRIVNSKLADHKTKTFGIRPLSNTTYYTLSYLDPDTGIAKVCTNNCVLSSNDNVNYQDFRIVDTSLTFGIAIDVLSWYGLSGGLASVQAFQSEIFVHATSADVSSCSLDSSSERVTTSGSWKRMNDTVTGPYLVSTISSLSSPPSITFQPHMVESGQYQVLAYTPGCLSSCSDRTSVDITINNAAKTTTTTTVNQMMETSENKIIFTGYFDLSSNFQPTISMTLAKNVTSVKSGMGIVAYAVQFIKVPSLGAIPSILQYNISATPTTDSSQITWGLMKDNIPYQAHVNTMALYNGNVYIGGNFTGTDKSNNKYTNLARYDSTTNTIKSLVGSPNNVIRSLTVVGSSSELYVGGDFTGIGGLSDPGLNYVARYNIGTEKWSSLYSGTNGPVNSINLMRDQTVILSGNFTRLLSPNSISNRVHGVGFWATSSNQWNWDKPYLNGAVYSVLGTSVADYFIGNVRGAQSHQANGLSFIANNALSPFAFDPEEKQSDASVGSVAYTDDNQATIISGQFDLPGNIKNLAVYEQGSWQGFPDAEWDGKVNAMAVHKELVYVGGQLVGSSIQHLAIFNIPSKSLLFTPQVKTNDGTQPQVNLVRYFPTSKSIIIAGHFHEIDSLSCVSICSFDVDSHQWNVMGSGLSGEIKDVTFTEGAILVTGDLLLEGLPVYIAQFDHKEKRWESLSSINLPFSSRAIAYDSSDKKIYISGHHDQSAYLKVWNGEQFDNNDIELGPGSVISHMSVLPLLDGSKEKTVVMASGLLNLGSLGNVSAAFLNGNKWTPYLVVSGEDDPVDSLSGIFFVDQYIINNRGQLATPLVILASIAISLGIVFIIVLISMLLVFYKKKNDAKINPQSNPSTYYGKPPRSTQSLMAMLKKAEETDDIKLSDNYLEKSLNIEPETHLYNMSKSFSQEQLHETSAVPVMPVFNPMAMTTARAAPVPPTIHSRTIPQNMTQFDYANTRPESYTRPVSEFQRDSFSTPMPPYMEMSEVSQNPFNPFKLSSSAGVASFEDQNKARSLIPDINSTFPASSVHMATVQPQSVTYGNVSVENIPELVAPAVAETVRWVKTPTEPSSRAIVQPVSMIDQSYPSAAPGSVQWIQTGGNDAKAQAVITSPPVVANDWHIIHNNESPSTPTPVQWMNNESHTHTMEKTPTPVQWINTGTSNNAKSQAVITSPEADINQSAYSPFPTPASTQENPPSSSNAFLQSMDMPSYPHPVPASFATAASRNIPQSNSNHVLWTNNNIEAAKGMVSIEPSRVSTYSTTLPQSDHQESLLNTLPKASLDFGSDPDFIQWTSAPASTAKFSSHSLDSTTGRPYSGERLQYKASLSSLAWPENMEYEDDLMTKNNDTSTLTVNRKVLDPNAFRLSTASSLPQIDTNTHRFNNQGDSPEVLSPDSAIRWKTANVASPVATGYAPLSIQKPAMATVTVNDSSLEDFYSKKNTTKGAEKPKKIEDTTQAPNENTPTRGFLDAINPSADGSLFDKYMAASYVPAFMDKDDSVSNNAVDKKEKEETPVTTKPSILTKMENVSKSSPTEDPIHLTNSTSTPKDKKEDKKAVTPKTPVDGRASSKRMIEEYLTTKTHKVEEKKSKYETDFRSIMASAIENNTQTEIATDDRPHLYYAKFDFSAREHGELGFVKADPIIVVDSSDDIWWMGYKSESKLDE